MHCGVIFWCFFQRKVNVIFSSKFLCSLVRTQSAQSAVSEMTRNRTPQITERISMRAADSNVCLVHYCTRGSFYEIRSLKLQVA